MLKEVLEKQAAEFINPFPGQRPDHLLTAGELISSIRQSIASEEEAAHFYDAIADATDNELAAKVCRDIANEEKVHKGEFQQLLETIDPDEAGSVEEGREEVEKMKEAAFELFEKSAAGRGMGPGRGKGPGVKYGPGAGMGLGRRPGVGFRAKLHQKELEEIRACSQRSLWQGKKQQGKKDLGKKQQGKKELGLGKEGELDTLKKNAQLLLRGL
jgi:rubrerythrin